MKRYLGFSLIELLIVLAIIGILAAIAYPSYERHVVKTRRTAAEGCLVELAQWMERYYTTNMSYINAALPNTDCQTDLANFYDFAFAQNQPTASSYEIQATAKGIQATKDASCSPLTIKHDGSRSPVGCW